MSFIQTALVLLVAIGALQGTGRSTVTAATVAWTGGQWFDGRQFTQVDVYSTGDRLTLKRPTHIDRAVDLRGLSVTPPFAEAHNHNIPGPEGMVETYLRQGIFYVMIQANVPNARSDYAGRINVPSSVDVAFSNGVFTAPGGHPSALVRRNISNGGMTSDDLDGGFVHPVASPADVDRAFARVARQRPDFIKLILVYSEDRTAGVPRPADSDRHGLDPALVPYIVKKAHTANLRVSSHVESAFDFDVAVNAGVDVIAHMPGFWPDERRIREKGLDQYQISDESARRAGEGRVSVVTTLGETLGLVADKKIPPDVGRQLLELYRHNLSTLVSHGATLAVGSDQFRSTSIPEALAIHSARLIPDVQLLRALSMDGARTIFPKRARLGPFEGAPADFIALAGNPLDDFTAIERIRIRVKSGRELNPAERARQ